MTAYLKRLWGWLDDHIFSRFSTHKVEDGDSFGGYYDD